MTTGYVLLALAGLATVELFLRMQVLARCKALAMTARRSERVLRRRASDHWKERAVTALCLAMMRHTLALALALTIVTSPLALLYLATRTWGLDAFAGMDFGPMHLALIAALVVYAALRRRLSRG